MSDITTIRLKTTDNLHRFEGQNEKGARIILGNDGHSVGPMQSLLMALAGCASIDVVMILEKMRQELSGLSVEVKGERREELPRIFTKIHAHFTLTGDVKEKKAEQAIASSFEKYCSVSHMVSARAEISHSFEIRSSESHG